MDNWRGKSRTSDGQLRQHTLQPQMLVTALGNDGSRVSTFREGCAGVKWEESSRYQEQSGVTQHSKIRLVGRLRLRVFVAWFSSQDLLRDSACKAEGSNGHAWTLISWPASTKPPYSILREAVRMKREIENSM